jgi:hypothetical protein
MNSIEEPRLCAVNSEGVREEQRHARDFRGAYHV